MSRSALIRMDMGARDRFSNLLDRSLGVFAAAVLAALMLLTLCDVIGRYFFNAPISGAYELVELMMGTLIFAALPVVTERDHHVTIDLLDPVTPLWLVPIRNAFMHLLSAAALAPIAWRLWELAVSKAEYGDVTTFLGIPLYPFAYGMSVLTGVTSLVSAILFVFEIAGWRWRGRRAGSLRP